MENKNLEEKNKESIEQLKKLQEILKQEIALRQIFLNNKEELFKKIETKTYEYYEKKLSIHEIFFNNKELSTTNKIYINYVLSKNCQTELPQCLDPLSKLFFYFRNDNEMLLKLIDKLDKLNYDDFANFICHFFYEDVFNCTSINEPLLVLIYLLLEKNIDDIKDQNLSMQFIDPSKTFISSLIKSLLRRNDVKVYFESIINKLVFDLEELKIINKKTISPFIGLEIFKLKDFIHSQHNLSKFKKIKEIKDYRQFLVCNIEKSSVVNLFNKLKEEKSEFIKENLKKNLFQNFENLFEKNNKNEDIKNNKEPMKEKREIKEENNTKTDKKPYKKINFYENIKNEAIDKILHGKTKNIKESFPKFRMRKYNELEEYFLSSNYYTINNDISNPILSSLSENLIDKTYLKELNKEEFISRMYESKTENMEEFYLNQIEIIEKEKNNDIFTNECLLNNILKINECKGIIDKVLILFKYNFEKMKKLIDKFLFDLIDNIPSIPYFIKCIASIIDKLILIKFPKISKIKKNAFLGEFFFNNLLFPLLFNPNFNGIIMKNSSINNTKKQKLVTLVKILQALYRGKLFKSNSSNESNYSIFNNYICEVMPSIFYFFDNLSNTELPKIIEDLLNKKQINLKEKNIQYDFFKFYENEGIEHQSICLNWKDYLLIYNILKNNTENILGESDSLYYKTFKKLTFHEKTFQKKISIDENKNQKTFIFLTNINYTNKMKDKLSNKKDKKFSFIGDDVENNEKFILTRLKYSINTIIKNLNELNNSTFHFNNNENFVNALNNLILLEGFSDILKEKTIPLQWFGLYLESNIDRIPQNLQENNFELLYRLLISECRKTLHDIQRDNTLNIIYSKVVNISKTINIINYNLIRLKNNEKKFEILNFVRTTDIHIKLTILINDSEFEGIKFETVNSENEDKKDDKNNNNENQIKICENLNQIFEFFPNISVYENIYVLELEKEKKVPESIKDFISIINKYIDDNNLFNHYSKNDLNDMKIEIENYIHQKLYSKIYPEISMGDDIEIYKNCFYLEWIKPEHIIKNYTSINENLINLGVKIINNMMNETCPRKKLNELQKLEEIIHNIIILYGYNEENFDDILFYTGIKAQPSFLSTCFNYLDMYTSIEKREIKTQVQMNALKKLIDKLKNISYKDLINVSEKEFEENKQKKIEIK